MTEMLLKVEQLKTHFPVKSSFLSRTKKFVYAVDGVSFELRRGETLGLVGESGCGKSTLGRSVLRLYEPTSGEVSFEGKDILKTSAADLRKLRKEMQIIFQDPYSSLNPRMRIREILSEPFQIHGIGTKEERIEKVKDLLREVGLPEEALLRYPHEFSGGQRQRIGIARALALRPKLIVADEPVSALDVSIQSQILNLLTDLKKKYGLSYLFIAHDLAVIQHISDRIAVMYLGRIVEMTDSNTIYEKPLHPYTRALIAAIPQPKVTGAKKKATVGGDVPSPMDPPPGCHFHTRCPFATDLCKKETPTLKNHSQSGSHLVACHYATKI